jgi:hypothetical protein
MSRELVVPLLPCRDVDESTAFYVLLGFHRTYHQRRPNPYAVVERGDIIIHLFGIEGFVPGDSYGSILIVTADIETLHREFAAGLRAGLGAVPVAGIPRMTRPRRKQGTTGGFSVVDPGGNWLRVSPLGESEDHERPASALGRVLENAARQGDARGDERTAIAALDAGLLRHPDADAAERLPLLVYRSELDIRIGAVERAETTLREVLDTALDTRDRELLGEELAAARELLDGLG